LSADASDPLIKSALAAETIPTAHSPAAIEASFWRRGA
jgi:hypothetical protein